MPLKQDDRVGEMTTPLGKDVLVLARIRADEGLSELFTYRIDAYSEQADLDFQSAIGQQCQTKIKTYGKERAFNGILTKAEWVGSHNELHRYRLVLRPWLWLLSRTSDCRIFQDQKAPDIIKKVFTDHGFNYFDFQLQADYPKLEYCVQFRETDLDFVSRLMEQHGIYYHFKHENDKHTLVLIDSNNMHKPVPGQEDIPFYPLDRQGRGDEERIVSWTSERRFRTTKVELKDYNYQDPNLKLVSDAEGRQKYNPELAFYDFPGKYIKQSDGDFYAKVRIEADQARDRRRFGEGDALSLFPGATTTLKKHPQDSQNIKYLITRCRHSFASQHYRSGGPDLDEPSESSGSFEFFPNNLAFRAPIVTPKPRVLGIQTAKVVNKNKDSDEEIDVENLGEIYVRFYWDRKEDRSCRLRVAQVWSGKNWGGQIIPRVGQEVVVEFLEGDPDRPLVVGTVYNNEYKPAYDLPSKKTIAGLMSNSSKGGSGFNEWNFEDKKGSEQINVHAEKDLNLVIRNVETRTIGEAFATGVSRDTTLKHGDDKLSVEMGNQTVDIKMDQTVNVDQSIKITAILKIELIVGPSKITIDPTGVKIDAPTITLNAMGLLTVKGGMVTIN
jgi:type VI secretion system secreted protein VgrG